MHVASIVPRDRNSTACGELNGVHSFFCDSISRDRFREITKFIRFDLKGQRFVRLCMKFGTVSLKIDRSVMFPEPTLHLTNNCFPQKRDVNSYNTWVISLINLEEKFWLAADMDTKYLLNDFPYLGKDDNRPPNQSLSVHVVMKLMTPYLGKSRNVTTDNFFTSMSLAEKLKMQSISLVGTVNRALQEILQSVKTRKAPLYNTIATKNNEATLTVYQGKKNKNVLALSTLHPNISIGNDHEHLPEIVSFYNATKYGVDVLDQMARKYYAKAPSRRWPVQVFYNILVLAGINAQVLFKQITENESAGESS
ncbi:hypothetical protein PR048_006057 [Dryococelus australis]|uniref:PiggyBac transposable element-derived protein domain-containing protein n=1 Tax=Dryococelus australis TaxID=614101 RepID=A0ABQ9I9X6_9NEOP|nr:hypothetical protein PR048_006057 [Dryococelus australis]